MLGPIINSPGGGDYDYIIAQRFNSSGTKLWGASGVTIKGNSAGTVDGGIEIASDGSGGFILVWSDDRRGNNTDFDVFVQRVNSAGSVQWTANGVSIWQNRSVVNTLDIIADGSGGAIVSWACEDVVYSYRDTIRAQRLNSSGSIQWTSGGVVVRPGLENLSIGTPSLVSDGSNGAIMAWQQRLSSGSTGWDVYAQRLNSSGVAQWTANGIPLANSIRDEGGAEALVDGSGGAFIVYEDAGNIYGQRVNSSGTKQWAAGGVSISSAANYQWSPIIVSDGSSGFVSLWTDGRNGSIEANIYAQKVNSSGTVQWTSNGVLVSNANSDHGVSTYSDYNATYDSSGNIYVAWGLEYAGGGEGYDFDRQKLSFGAHAQSNEHTDVYAQMFDSSGNSKWTSGGELVSDAADDQHWVEVVFDGTSSMYVVWTDRRVDYGDVYGQHITDAPDGGVIQNLEEGFTATVTEEWTEDATTELQEGETGIGLRNTSNDLRIAEMTIDFDDNKDWDNLSLNAADNKSFFHYPGGFSSLPGSSGSGYSLYIPIPNTRRSTEIIICPNATSLGDVTTTCSGAITKTEADADASQVWIENQKYWKIDGLTGTGGVSITSEFDLKDTLTRLQVSVASDHTIEFGSVNGLLDIGDTIEVQFDPSGLNWNLTGVVLGDIDLEDDGTDLSLAASADATHWGVSVSTVTDTITFTHPTAADFEDIAADSELVVKIGTVADGGSNQITNPGTASSYEITMKNTYSANGGGTETGEVEIPIVDDDTVNITGYIDTLLSFDIDTASSDVNCDASGGASPCDSHSSASDDSGYVVDLGEMTLSSVNRSGDSVLHADGLTGNINYIWFDLESNGDGGVVVTLVSQHESMYMDASNEIPDVATGSEQQITSADGLYGLNHRSGFTNTAVSGSLVVHVDCDCTSGDDYYCDVSDGGTPVEVFNSNSGPVDDGRVQWAVGVAPDSSDGTGTYSDQLTFVATSTF